MSPILVAAAAGRVLTYLRAAVPEMKSLARRVAECDEPVDLTAVTEAIDRLTVLGEQMRAHSQSRVG